MNVLLVNTIQMIVTAIVIAISSKVIGALMVSALMVIPYATSIQLTKNYKKSMIFSIIFSLLAVILGLTLSYYLDLQSGGTIVLSSTVLLIITMIVSKIFKIKA